MTRYSFSRWIGRRGPRSHDFTPLDFFFWGYVKNKVYATPFRDPREIREHIINPIESIPEDMFQRTGQEVADRLDILTLTAGAPVDMR